MGLIQDEDLVAVSRWSKNGPFPKLPRIINTVMTGSVDFDDVQRTATIVGKLQTTGTRSTRSVGGPFVTVPAFGKNPRRGGLSTSPRA